jgi:diguanylate cyclase (GGDEF)-like protein
MAADLAFEKERASRMMIGILSQVVEKRNGESRDHVQRVAQLTSMLLAGLAQKTDRYPLTREMRRTIATAAALHDIGKMEIGEQILNSPEPRTPEDEETMRQHTLLGARMLEELDAYRDEDFVRVAYQICRWHHERWDGRGYPDGLKGDEIPISAQVVAMADVYDALTSERCYKKSFDHATAVKMITNGECGAFNPLLIQCLLDVQDQLFENMHTDPRRFDYRQEAKRLSDEMLEQKELMPNNRAHSLLTFEQKKAEFFAEQCGGIQFEFDHWTNTVHLKDWNAPVDQREKSMYLTEWNDVSLLSEKDWLALREKLKATTPERPEVKMIVQIPVNGEYRWQRLTVKSLWTAKHKEYAGVLGHFEDIQDEMVRRGEETLEKCSEYSVSHLLKDLSRVFEVVRLVDPKTNENLELDKGGKVITTPIHCYEIWGRNEPCENCISSRSLEGKEWVTKLEMRDRQMYFVLSKHINVNGRTCTLEIASHEDEAECARCGGDNDAPTRSSFMNFYRDTLTGTYTRLYLESFQSNLESADAVAIVDVDLFKQINDTYGHPVGDEALKTIANTIRSGIRGSDTLIRYGGDEFLLIFSKIGEEVFYERLKQLRRAVQETKLPDYPEVKLDVSLGGVYRVHPLSEAIRQADLRMYENKAKHANANHAESR